MSAAVCAGLALAAAGCGDRTARERTLVLAECRLPRLAAAAKCGQVEVPENRERPAGRKLSIHVAVLPANTLDPAPDPLVILAGGPGQAASHLAPFAAALIEVRRTRDVVLIDQRGTGRSSPLVCDAFAASEDLAEALEADSVPKARACLADLQAQDVDVTQFTTAAWIADLDAVRAALGYPRLNLWGGSYGTRVALEYLRRHPERVRSLILDGVAPPGMRLPVDIWPARERALDGVLEACALSPACRSRHPDLPRQLAALAAAFASPGRDVDVVDPRTGDTRTLNLTFDTLLAGFHALTYAPERAALLPEVIGRAADGDLAPLLAAAQWTTGALADQLNAALHFAVTCAEDAPRVTAADREALARTRSGTLAANVLAVCDMWPRGAPAAASAPTLASDVPVLVLSGGLDPVTPPANGAAVAAQFRNSRHIVAPGYGHIVSPHACGPQLIAAFVATPDGSRLPAACVEHFEKSVRSPLWPDRMGPQP